MSAGLSHITLLCRDVDRMAEIVTGVLNGREVYDSGENRFSIAREKFFLVGEAWLAVMEGAPRAGRSYEHVAFRIDEAAFDDRLARIERMGLDLHPPRPRVAGEGRSIYFYDEDDHLFELHTGTLNQRLARYAEGKAE